MRASDEHVLLRSALGLSRREALPLENRLRALGGLRGLWNARSEGLGGALSSGARERLDAIFALLDRLLGAHEPPARIDCAESAAAYFRRRIGLEPCESFWVLMLDAHGRVIGEECISVGTLTACLVHPREIFAPALRARAAQILVVHNHPSGDPSPSPEDIALTERLTAAGVLLGIPLIDHLVVALRGHRSLGVPHDPCSGETLMWESSEDLTLSASRDPPAVRGSAPDG